MIEYEWSWLRFGIVHIALMLFSLPVFGNPFGLIALMYLILVGSLFSGSLSLVDICWDLYFSLCYAQTASSYEMEEQKRQRKLDKKQKKLDKKRQRAEYVASPQYEVDNKKQMEQHELLMKMHREQEEWDRTHTSGGDCPMCGNNMIVLIRPLPFKDECDKCKYTFTFVYKKINLGKNYFGDTEYGDGIKPTRPKPPRATPKSTGREPIPQDLMDAVWNRDGGQCVKCNSNQDLEYDHIIPLSKGGSSRYRNLQILCIKCNRSKSDNIG